MIIDAHSHWLPEEIINNAHFFSKVWGDVETQIQAMDAAGVDRVILSYPTTDAHTRMGGLSKVAALYNERIAAVAKMRPERFVAAAILPVDDPPSIVREYERATRDLGCRAVSLATSFEGVFLDDKRYWPLYERAQDERVPIFVHPQIVRPIGFSQVDDPLLTPVIEYIFETTMCIGKMLMAGLFLRFENLVFVFSYFGGVTPFIVHRYEATYAMLRGINFVKDLGKTPREHLKTIYVDTSGDTTLANFQAALDLVGPGHLLWGSDYPAKKDMSSSMKVLDCLDLGRQDKADILGGNLERILKTTDVDG